MHREQVDEEIRNPSMKVPPKRKGNFGVRKDHHDF